MARHSDTVLLTQAGPEIGVASTKAFTTQLTVLACLVIFIAAKRGAIDRETEKALCQALTEVPGRTTASGCPDDHEKRQKQRFVRLARNFRRHCL